MDGKQKGLARVGTHTALALFGGMRTGTACVLGYIGIDTGKLLAQLHPACDRRHTCAYRASWLTDPSHPDTTQ